MALKTGTSYGRSKIMGRLAGRPKVSGPGPSLRKHRPGIYECSIEVQSHRDRALCRLNTRTGGPPAQQIRRMFGAPVAPPAGDASGGGRGGGRLVELLGEKKEKRRAIRSRRSGRALDGRSPVIGCHSPPHASSASR